MRSSFGSTRAGTAQAATRRGNRRQVLQSVINANGQVSRADLARSTGLTNATISSIITDLIAEGFVVEGGTNRSTGGKPGTSLLVGHVNRIAAIIIEPPRIRGALVSMDASIDPVLDLNFDRDAIRITDIIDVANDLVTASSGSIIAIGIQLPGVVENGRVTQSMQLGWADIDVATTVQEAIGVPVHVINDANAKALAEVSLGTQDNRDHMTYLLQSTGLGLALVVDSRLLLGSTMRAGEIAHVPLVARPTAERCSCGNRGCFETVGAIPALLGIPYASDLGEVDFDALLTSESTWDRIAMLAIELVKGIALIATAVDSPTIVIGGWGPRLGERYLDILRGEAARLSMVGASALDLRFARATGSEEFLGAGQFALENETGLTFRRERAGL